MLTRNLTYTSISPARRGIQVTEMLLALPAVLIVFAAAFTFGPLVLVQATIANSAIETAREVSKMYQFDVNDIGDVAKAITVADSVLSVNGLSVDPLSADSTGVLMVIETAGGVACSGDATLEPAYCPASTSVVSAEEIRVSIIVDVESAPVPGLLETFCVDLSDRYYEVSAVVQIDCP